MQKRVNLVDLIKSFPTNIFLQTLASIQKRTSPTKFDHFAEKSEYGPISNLSTKLRTGREDAREEREEPAVVGWNTRDYTKLNCPDGCGT